MDEGTVPRDWEDEEMAEPSPRKVNDDCIIYESRPQSVPKEQGRPILIDFGEARFGSRTYTDDIHPYQYRAPEVILDIPWSFSADIWNLGVMVGLQPCVDSLTFFESNHL